MTDPFAPIVPPRADNRRRTDRVYIPVRIVVPGTERRIVGRVRDASARGLQLELSAPLPEDVVTARLEGWAQRGKDLLLHRRWTKADTGPRVLVGAEAGEDLTELIEREQAAYQDLDLVLAQDMVDVSALSKRARRSVTDADDVAVHYMARYADEVPQPRSPFLWGWVLAALDLTALPGIDPALVPAVRTAKFLGVMLDVVLDDVADNGGTPTVVLAACQAVFADGPLAAVPADTRGAISLGKDIWEEIKRIVSGFPLFEGLRGFLRYDYRQLENAMHYAALLNQQPYAANSVENLAYQCHNMHMVASGTMDLMARDRLEQDEIGQLRELMYYGQLMGRVGNAVTTWPRELAQGDFTSTFFSTLGELSGQPVDRLREMSLDALSELERAVGAERAMLHRWLVYRDRAREVAGRIRSLAAHDYVDGLEELLFFHLASRGLK